MAENEKKNLTFSDFWKEQAKNLITGLVVTLVLCGFMGVRRYVFSLPVWITIALVFWLLRMWLLYKAWKRRNS